MQMLRIRYVTQILRIFRFCVFSDSAELRIRVNAELRIRYVKMQNYVYVSFEITKIYRGTALDPEY